MTLIEMYKAEMLAVNRKLFAEIMQSAVKKIDFIEVYRGDNSWTVCDPDFYADIMDQDIIHGISHNTHFVFNISEITDFAESADGYSFSVSALYFSAAR